LESRDVDMIIRKVASSQLHARGLDDEVIAFDKVNMGPILEAKGIPFPEEKRRKGFEGEQTFHIAFDPEERIVGYLEYGPDWNDAEAIYISSLQIAPAYRNTGLFLRLLASAASDLERKPFTRIVAGVQKHNSGAIRIYRRLGFSVDEDPASGTSCRVSADRSILGTRLVGKLLSRLSPPFGQRA